MDAIDLFLKACDKTIQLLNYRTEREKRFIDEVIKPFFQQAEAATQDYYTFLNSCLQELQENHVSESTVKKLGAQRERMKLARTTVCATAQAMRSVKEFGSELEALASGIEGIFYSSYVPRCGIPSEYARGNGVRIYDPQDPELIARAEAPGSPRITDFPLESAEIRELRGTENPAEIIYSEGYSNSARFVDLFQLAALGKTSESVLKVQIIEAKLALEYYWSQANAAYARISLRNSLRR